MSGRRLAWVLLPVLVLALALEVRGAVRRLQASLVLARVKQVTLEADRMGRLPPGMLDHNAKLLRRVEALSPVEVGLPIARGGQYLLLDRPRAAARTFEKALAIEPRGEVYALLGRALAAAGDRPAADRALRTAILLDPSRRRELRGLLSSGEPPGARKSDE